MYVLPIHTYQLIVLEHLHICQATCSSPSAFRFAHDFFPIGDELLVRSAAYNDLSSQRSSTNNYDNDGANVFNEQKRMQQKRMHQ